MLLTACGSGAPSQRVVEGQRPDTSDHSPKEVQKPQLAMSRAEIAQLPEFKVRVPTKSPPKKLVVHDLRKGSGAEIRPNDAILVDFFNVRYEPGKSFKTTPTTRNSPERFGLNEVIEGWKKGLPGMRVGGRRELIVPPELGYRGWTLIYVIDLLAVYRGGATSF
jgi:peptidylprolyl isomerase